MAKEVTLADIKRLMLSNYRKFKQGEITESQAYKENVILSGILKAFEISENSERLEAIENALSNSK